MSSFPFHSVQELRAMYAGGRADPAVRRLAHMWGRARLLRKSAIPCTLVEVPADDRAPVIKRYLDKVPGARPHISAGRHAPLADFNAIAARYPVFLVVPQPPVGALATAPGPGQQTSQSTAQPTATRTE
jgi:hypothetical protein